ncbi:MAG: Tfp pilus assembly protein FimV [Candidatus Accumulibacter adjunctus]|uniref:Tfp pilus assembly protein FimV n=1 Tax=Candidatus Accumulibacter adjunctus TaxID=1454001 RepID=A0A011N0N3_9PROT|nr:MAG: Tfp pilus assembly protein FimV [Candidatus Accumulibacter adjunctus]
MKRLNALDLSPMLPGITHFRAAVMAAILPPLLVWSTGTAQGATLGKMTVLSTLGSRFEAVVEMASGTGDGKRMQAECFRLAPTGEGDLPTLRNARLTVEESAGRRHLRISSEQTINEPLLQVNVRVGCGAETGRNYVLLIDPAHRRAQPANLARPQSRDRQSPASSLAAVPLATPAAADGSPGRLAGAAGTGTAQAPAPPREPSRRTTAAARAGDRLLLSGEDEVVKALPGDEHPLRLSTRLSTELLGKSSESQRAMLRIEYQLLSALHTQAAQQLAIAQQIRQLESTLEALHRKSATQPLPVPAAVAATATSAANSDAPSRATREASPVRSPGPPAAAARETDWWFEGSLLLGLIAALAWFLRRRSLAPPSTAASANAEQPPDTSADESRWELQIADDGSERHRGGATAIAAESQRADDDGHVPTASSLRESDDEATAVLELAEIMLSFGRTKGAQHALEEFIAQQPMAAVTPWLKLLEVYRQGNEQTAFESLALKLTSLFNVAAPAWQTAEQLNAPIVTARELARMPIEQILTRLPTIDRMTHIRRELLRLWDTPGCPAYLDKLLRDNRKGERRGFELTAVRELLVLTDIQQEHPRPAR